MKKFFVAVLALVMLVCIFTACNKDDSTVYNSELVKYGDLESSLSSSGWEAAYALASSNSPAIVNDNAYTDPVHLSNIRLNNNSSDYTSVKQVMTLENKGVYKLTVDVKVTSLKKNDYKYGANIGFAESDAELLNITAADDQWHTYTVYFQPKKLESYTLLLQLGDADNYAIGEVRYDNISIHRVENADGATIIPVLPTVVKVSETSQNGLLYTIILGVISAALCFAAYITIRRKYAKEIDQKFKDFFNSPILAVIVICVVGFALRLLLTIYLFQNDNISINFATYCKSLTEYKLTELYSGEIGNYAPGALYVQWIIGQVINLLKIESNLGMIIMSKAPAMLADVVIMFLLFYVGRKYTNFKVSAVMAGLYAILPVAFTISAANTLMLPVTVLLLLLTFLAILDKNYILMFVWYFMAAFFSEIALTVLPFILAFAVYIFIKNEDKKTRLTLCLGIAVSFVLLYAASLPFTLELIKDGKPFYIIRKYYELSFGNQLCVDNAFNLYGIFNLNQKDVTSAANVLNILFIVALITYTLSLYFKNRNRAELMMLTSFFIIGVSVFCLNMNETGMYLGLAMLMLYILVSGEKRLFASFAMLSTISFVNVSQYLNISGVFAGGNSGADFAAKSPMMIIGGILAVLATIYFGWVAYDITINGKREDILPLYEQPVPAFKHWVKYLLGKEE